MTIGHTHHGKWSLPEVPHKGWVCVGVEDLEEPCHTCAMCESALVRYVHTMEHPAYPEPLDVGCVCAEHMEDDYVGPRQREQSLRARARRQQAWDSREWRRSKQGNLYLNTEGYNLTAFPRKGDGWGLKVTRRATGVTVFGDQTYSTAAAAQAGALTALLWAKTHL